KNSIDRQRYQPVPEESHEVSYDRDSRLRLAGLGSGRPRQAIQALFEPSKIQPGQNRADEYTRAPTPSVKVADGEGCDDAENESEVRNPQFGLPVGGIVNDRIGHRYCLETRRSTSRKPPKKPRKPSTNIRKG